MPIKNAIIKSAKSLGKSFPLIIGTILLISLISNLIPASFYPKIFGKNILINSIIGSGLGSISAGTPIISYIIGGELLEQGISLIAVTAFIIAWVTVGIMQLPAESIILGKKFAFIRNLTAFLLAIIAAFIIVLTLEVLKCI